MARRLIHILTVQKEQIGPPHGLFRCSVTTTTDGTVVVILDHTVKPNELVTVEPTGEYIFGYKIHRLVGPTE